MDKINLVPLPPLPSAEELFSPAPTLPLADFDPVQLYCTIPTSPTPPNEVCSSKQPTSPQRPEAISPLSPVSKTEFFKGTWNNCEMPTRSSREPIKRASDTDASASIPPELKRAKYDAVGDDITCPIVLSPSDNAADDSVEEGEITDDSDDDCKVSLQTKTAALGSKISNNRLLGSTGTWHFDKRKSTVDLSSSSTTTNGRSFSHLSSRNYESARRLSNSPPDVKTYLDSKASKSNKLRESRHHGSEKHASVMRPSSDSSSSRDGHHNSHGTQRSCSNQRSSDRRSSDKGSSERRSSDRRSSERRSSERRSSERRSSDKGSSDRSSSRSYDRSKYSIVKSKHPNERSKYRSERASLNNSETIKETAENKSSHHHRSIYDFAKQPSVDMDSTSKCLSNGESKDASCLAKTDVLCSPTSVLRSDGESRDAMPTIGHLPGYSKFIADPRRKPVGSQVPCSSASTLMSPGSEPGMSRGSNELQNSAAVKLENIEEQTDATTFTQIACDVPNICDAPSFATLDQALNIEKVEATVLFDSFVEDSVIPIIKTTESLAASGMSAERIQNEKNAEFYVTSEVLSTNNGFQSIGPDNTQSSSASQIMLQSPMSNICDSMFYENLEINYHLESYTSSNVFDFSFDPAGLAEMTDSNCIMYQTTQSEEKVIDGRDWSDCSLIAENNKQCVVSSSCETNIQVFVEPVQLTGIHASPLPEPWPGMQTPSLPEPLTGMPTPSISEMFSNETVDVEESQYLNTQYLNTTSVDEINAETAKESSTSCEQSTITLLDSTEQDKLTCVPNVNTNVAAVKQTNDDDDDITKDMLGVGHEFNIIDDLGSDYDDVNELEVSINSSDAESVSEVAPKQEEPAEVKPARENFFRRSRRPENRPPRPFIQTEDGEGFEGPDVHIKTILIGKHVTD